ncbi:MAG: hypothetical protein GWN07_07560 [Actinobacteria bacterium]|nr:hypothetical protein [Actinomycetota bacterium]NIU65328.1 hypothetical protein [Actinomycetota bacterium]NIV86330.1 hypothetical protein [Actinomycetota bacterium]NIW27132.1 hypothetical protein [Actinomycetota bacterium]NIX19688.1 hypothetical protein [Actinomycetota bacterium]
MVPRGPGPSAAMWVPSWLHEKKKWGRGAGAVCNCRPELPSITSVW